MIIPILSKVLPSGRHGKHSVLIFHRILDESDTLFPHEWTKEDFRTLLEFVSSTFNVITVGEASELMRNDCLPARSLSITFDDGYQDNYSIAFPLLKEYELKATFFVATAYLNGGMMWNDVIVESVRNMDQARVSELEIFGVSSASDGRKDDRYAVAQQIIDRCKYMEFGKRDNFVREITRITGKHPSNSIMMTDIQVNALHKAGMEIGGHTHGHPILASLENEKAEREIRLGKEYLERILGEEIGSFAYPNGGYGKDFQDQHARMVKNLGFKVAVTTDYGVASKRTSPFLWPRFTPWHRPGWMFTTDLVRNRFGLI